MARDNLIREARERFQAAFDADAENRTEGEEDLRFAAGEQFPETVRKAREAEGRPCLVFNRLGPYIRQVTGDIRLNPPAINVRAQDNGADPKLAKTFTGLIRNIEADSNAVAAYVTAAENAARCGIGWIMVRTEYASDSAYDLNIKIKRVPSPWSVLMDPMAIEPSREDADWGFFMEDVSEDSFKSRFKGASLDGWDQSDSASGWRTNNAVRVAEYWRKVPVTRNLVLCRNGACIDVTDLKPGEARAAIEAAGGMVREREVKTHKIVMDLMNGVEVLQERTEWAGRFLPMVPVLGEEIHIGDRVIRHGLVRFARGPQTLYNVQRNAYTEAAAMAPKPKWLVTPEQIAGHEAHWAAANTSNFAYLPYNSTQSGPPGRIAPDMPAAAILQDMQASAADIEAAIGIFREGLGKESNAESGKAILSRQREGDVGSYLYMDNLRTAVAHVGRICVDLIPKIYDTARVVRTLGEDGAEEFVQVNQEVVDPLTGQVVKVNDLSVGCYDVTASTGPSFSTRREEAREAMLTFMQAMPQASGMIADLFAKYQDWPGGEEIAARLRKMAVAQGIAKPEEGDDPPAPPPPDPNMLLAQAEMAKAQAAMMKAQADVQVKLAELENEKVRLAIEAQKAGVDANAALSQAAAKHREVNIKEFQAMHGAQESAQRMSMDRQDRMIGHVKGAAEFRRSGEHADRDFHRSGEQSAFDREMRQQEFKRAGQQPPR